jgi:Tfp pilus assembly protein PilX
MKLQPKFHFERSRMTKQRGVVLFFALIALVAMSLAAVALIRSVDTSTLIAGNLGFKQAAATSGDAGTEAAINWLLQMQNANSAKNVITDATHPFNITDLAANPGYFSNADPGLNLTASSTWNDTNSVLVGAGPDSSGNTVRYLIQRMCRNANVPIQDGSGTVHCLFGVDPANTNPQNVPLPSDICEGTGCPPAGRTPLFRITTRITGPNLTLSYIQAFVN